jgi:hypothetical protein
MRRAILAAMLICSGLAAAARADSWYGPRYPYHVYYSGKHCCPYGYKTWGYGLPPLQNTITRSRVGPGSGPWTGPGQYIYAGSMGTYRPASSVQSTIATPAESTSPAEMIPQGDLPYPTTDGRPAK